ncbi:NADH-quinone oxidoreductase, E subunit [Verrucomicrobia bacterium]|nr:NADH-quinone oxidoreductase, E subunit [Verrucomicrobiota bacterium]
MKEAAQMIAAEMTQVVAMNVPPIQPLPNPLLEQPDFAVTAELAAEADELVSHYPRKRSASLMLLHAVQDRFGYISRQAVEWIAARLELQPINIYELVTFYPMLRQRPPGKYQLKVCRTLSCALGGSYQLHRRLCEKLGLDPEAPGPQTTPDGHYTVEFVECLASCGTAPVMMCNDTFYEAVSEQKAEEILRQAK